MNAGTTVLVLCLTTFAIGQPCVRKQKPSFDCKNAPASGVFFPHPNDCTYLVVCIAGQDVEVSLCDESEFGNVYDPKYSLGCPKKCAQLQPACQSSPSTPLFVTSTRPAPSSTTTTLKITPPTSTSEQPTDAADITNTVTPVTGLANQPIVSESSPTGPTTGQPEQSVADDLSCKRGGMAAHPIDCKQALICPSADAQAILFNICENVARDSTFPVGCPQKCAGWRPDVFSETDSAQ